MDLYATLHAPVEQVFARAADPTRLQQWLPDVAQVDIDQTEVIGIGATFAVVLRAGGREQVLEGEVVAYEPPWLVAYRLLLPEPRLVRLVCTGQAETRIHLHQSDGADQLAVDLARLGSSV